MAKNVLVFVRGIDINLVMQQEISNSRGCLQNQWRIIQFSIKITIMINSTVRTLINSCRFLMRELFTFSRCTYARWSTTGERENAVPQLPARRLHHASRSVYILKLLHNIDFTRDG